MDTFSHNYRAFSRNDREASIIYAFHNTDKYYSAKMRNSGAGGMYFESEHNSLRRGSDIWIKMVDYSADAHGDNAREGYRAEVAWCRKMTDKDDTPCYGVGVRFMVDTCDHCGGKFSHREIHKTDDLLFLCSSCLQQFRSLPDGKIKGSVEQYLMGNVI